MVAPQHDWKDVFIAALSESGNVSKAAQAAGVHRRSAYKARDADETFAAQWAEACEVAADMLELEARRRAVEGTLKPVFYQGQQCGEVREYSDQLLMFLLRGLRPHVFRESTRITMAGDPHAPIKHDHVVTVTDRIAELAAAFEGAADRAEGQPPDAPSEKPE